MKTSPVDDLVRPFGFSSYDHYLRSKQWSEFKERYKNSELPQHCIECGSDKDIQLHHLTYVRVCREDLDDVVPLCGTCHMTEHKIKREWIKRKTPRLCKLCTTERDTPGPCSCRVKPCLDCGHLIEKSGRHDKCKRCRRKTHIQNGENRSICYTCKMERFPQRLCQCIKTKIKEKCKKPKKIKVSKKLWPPGESKTEYNKVERIFCDTCKRQAKPLNHCVCKNYQAG